MEEVLSHWQNNHRTGMKIRWLPSFPKTSFHFISPPTRVQGRINYCRCPLSYKKLVEKRDLAPSLSSCSPGRNNTSHHSLHLPGVEKTELATRIIMQKSTGADPYEAVNAIINKCSHLVKPSTYFVYALEILGLLGNCLSSSGNGVSWLASKMLAQSTDLLFNCPLLKQNIKSG